MVALGKRRPYARLRCYSKVRRANRKKNIAYIVDGTIFAAKRRMGVQ